jgi:hypothetical protein
MLVFLDILFTIIHMSLIAFNLAGWAWKRTRKLHFIVLLATAASWFILGIWYGWGYCPLTSWHWEIKEQLGETNLPASFIKYHADKLSGRDIPSTLVDNVTLGGLMLAVLASVYVNFIAGKIRKSNR